MLTPLRIIAGDPGLRLAAVAVMLIGALGASIGPYASLIAIKVFGLSDSAYSLVLAAASVVAVTAALGVGILTDQRANRRRIAVLSALLFLSGLVLVRVGNSPQAFVLAHAVILPLAGTLYGQVFALSRLAASSYPASERDAILSAIRALFALPFIVVLPLWALAFQRGAGLLGVYVVTSLLAGLIVVLIWRHWPRDGETRWPDPKSGLTSMAALREIAVPRVALRIVLLGAMAGGGTLYMVLLGLIFDQVPGRGASDTALFVGFVAGLEVPVMLSLAGVQRHIGRAKLIAVGAVIYAGFLALFPLLAATPLVWLLVIPAALGGGIIIALPIAYLQDLVGTRPGMGGALLAVYRVVGDGIAAAVFAFGTFASGYGLVAVLGAGIMVCAGITLARIDKAAPA